MSKCTNCGYEIPGEAAFCPSCGKAIADDKAMRQKTASSVRGGAVIGLIGYAGLALLVCLFGLLSIFAEPAEPSPPKGLAGTLNEIESNVHEEQLFQGAMIIGLFIAAFLITGLVCFIIGLVRAGSMKRSHLIVLSSICLAVSSVTLVTALAWMNVFLLFFIWMVGWQPILMTVGAYKMLSASLKMPKAA